MQDEAQQAVGHQRQFVRAHGIVPHQQRLHVQHLNAATHQLGVARYYLRKDQDYAADLYLTAVQREYPNSAAAREALTLQSRLPRSSPPPATTARCATTRLGAFLTRC